MPPIHMLIKPASSLCNMRCKYCFYSDVSEHREIKSYGLMDIALLEKITEKALSEAEGECSFSFQGGEPTLVGTAFYEKLLELQKQDPNITADDIAGLSMAQIRAMLEATDTEAASPGHHQGHAHHGQDE